jgi:hypothetical protein
VLAELSSIKLSQSGLLADLIFQLHHAPKRRPLGG